VGRRARSCPRQARRSALALIHLPLRGRSDRAARVRSGSV
jgi:hypothetical protein